MSCAPVVQALLSSHYSYQQGLLSCKLRAAITCIVLKKTLLVSAVDMSAFSTGQHGVALWLCPECMAEHTTSDVFPVWLCIILC